MFWGLGLVGELAMDLCEPRRADPPDPAPCSPAHLQVIVKPKLQGFDETVDFDADELRKVFKVGVDHGGLQGSQERQGWKPAHRPHMATAGWTWGPACMGGRIQWPAACDTLAHQPFSLLYSGP